MLQVEQLNKNIILLVWHQLKANRLQFFNNIVAGLIIVALDFFFVWITKKTIDIATDVSNCFSLTTATFLLVITMVLQLIISAWRSWINAMLSVKATNKMQLDIFKNAISTPWLFRNKYHSGDLVNRIEKDVNIIINFVTDTLPSFFVVAVQFCGAFAFLYLMDKNLSLFIVIIIPFFLILSKLYVKKIRRISRRVRDIDSRLQSQYQESIHNNIIIRTLEGAISVFLSKICFTQDLLVNFVRRRSFFSITSTLVVNFGFACAYLFTFIWGTYHLSKGLITYGTLIAFIQLVAQIQRPARGMIKFVPEIIGLLTSGERLLEIKQISENSASESVLSSTSEASNVYLEKLEIGVKLTNVSFGYDQNKLILDNVSYDFPPRSRTLISAPTGRGKTTLIRLMMGLFRPNCGDISVYNDKFSYKIGSSTLSLFAYVPQGNTLFSGTIRSNLKLAAPNATDEELYHVLKIVKADFIKGLPQGLSTPCGESGTSLSEGQAQRICIARTLLKNAPVLLLDEATSALDEETEATLLNNINVSYPNTTIICISHRQKAREFCTAIFKL